MIVKELEDKIIEFTVKHNLQFAEINERPWGSWDLILRTSILPAPIPCRTFGSAYTLNQAIGTYFQDAVQEKLPYDHMMALRVSLGEDFMNELKTIVEGVTNSDNGTTDQ